MRCRSVYAFVRFSIQFGHRLLLGWLAHMLSTTLSCRLPCAGLRCYQSCQCVSLSSLFFPFQVAKRDINRRSACMCDRDMTFETAAPIENYFIFVGLCSANAALTQTPAYFAGLNNDSSVLRLILRQGEIG